MFTNQAPILKPAVRQVFLELVNMELLLSFAL